MTELQEKQKRKAEREKKRMAKYRRLGLDYEREMARKKAAMNLLVKMEKSETDEF